MTATGSPVPPLMTPAQAEHLLWHPRAQWGLFALAFAALASWITYETMASARYVQSAAIATLEDQARQVERGLRWQLAATTAAMELLAEQVPAPTMDKGSGQSFTPWLKAITTANPSARSMLVFDAAGKVRFSSLPELIGRNFASRDYFQGARQLTVEGTYFSAPYTTALSANSVTLARPLLGRDGGFEGAVTVTLDPDAFAYSFASLGSEADLRAQLVRADGTVFASYPNEPGSFGRPAAQLVLDYLARGLPDQTLESEALVAGERRIVALRTAQLGGLELAPGFVVVLSREKPAVMAALTAHERWYWAVFFGLFILTFAALVFHQRRGAVAQAAVGRMQRVLAEAGELAAVGGWETDRNGTLMWTPETYRLHEVPNDFSLSVETAMAFYPEPGRQTLREAVNDCLRHGGHFSFELPMSSAKGNDRWVQIAGGAYLEEGKIVSVIGSMQNITERKARESMYVRVVTTALNGFWLLDQTGAFLDVNDAACTMLGYSRAEMLTMSIPDIEASENPKETQAHMARIVAHGADRFVSRHRAKDGRVIEVDIAATYWPEKLRYIVFVNDISHLKSAERQLQQRLDQLTAAQGSLQVARARAAQAEKLAAIGTLVGGVAHEINNPLMGLSSYIDYARQHLEEGRPREMLGRAQREVERIGRLVRDMLAFSRIKPQQAGDRADLAAAVTRALDFAREQGVLADIDVEVAVAAHTMVQCDEDSLHQVLLNLLINARDALALRASPRHLQIELGEAETDWVTLCVTDNGGTIPDEVRQRLFEPFYSTKGAGKGTGLGLAVSRQIIESAGGAIRLDVNYLAGARFIIRLKKEKRGEQREPEKNSGH